MARSFQASDTPEARLVLEGQLRECYARAVYSHKTHEKCADILLARLGQIKFWQIVLASVTTAGFIGAVFDSTRIIVIVGAVISTALLVLNAYMKDYDLGSIAQKHKDAANDIWLIRERYLSLITDLRILDKPLEAVQEDRDKLASELYAVYAGSPSTTYQAYRKAQDALQRREDMTFSDEEIDAFLPGDLKRGE